MQKKEYNLIYQKELAKMYATMDGLVKSGKMPPGWQRDREAVRTVKKAAKQSTKNVIEKLEGRYPVASYLKKNRPDLYKKIIEIKNNQGKNNE